MRSVPATNGIDAGMIGGERGVAANTRASAAKPARARPGPAAYERGQKRERNGGVEGVALRQADSQGA